MFANAYLCAVSTVYCGFTSGKLLRLALVPPWKLVVLFSTGVMPSLTDEPVMPYHDCFFLLS